MIRSDHIAIEISFKSSLKRQTTRIKIDQFNIEKFKQLLEQRSLTLLELELEVPEQIDEAVNTLTELISQANMDATTTTLKEINPDKFLTLPPKIISEDVGNLFGL